jgi:glycosyltransferase involved in cell wall biosynthesis
MPRLKVLYLAQRLTIGGAEELLLGLATRLPADRFEVVVGCLTREDLIAQELKRAGVRVELLPGEPGPRDLPAFGRLLQFVRAERPDIVHTFLLNAGLYGRLAAWLARVPAIYHAEQNVYFKKSRRHLLFERFLASRTTRVIACCQAVADFYRRQVRLDSRRLEVIYNGVEFAALEQRTDRAEARASLGYGPDDIVLGCRGRLTEQKGHDVLLEALAQLKEHFPTTRLFLAGQGPYEADLASRVSRLGLASHVRFLGIRRDRGTLYAAMDVFALPSRWEGLSLALVEAAGAGLPIVATNVGGNPEVVQPGPGVWLVPPNEPSDLAAALATAVATTADAASTGPKRYPRPSVRERFGLARHLTLLEASYRSALPAAVGERAAAPTREEGGGHEADACESSWRTTP